MRLHNVCKRCFENSPWSHFHVMKDMLKKRCFIPVLDVIVHSDRPQKLKATIHVSKKKLLPLFTEHKQSFTSIDHLFFFFFKYFFNHLRKQKFLLIDHESCFLILQGNKPFQNLSGKGVNRGLCSEISHWFYVKFWKSVSRVER